MHAFLIISSREGDQWLKMRKVLRQKILKPEDVSVFSGPVNEVITDLIKRIHTLKRQEEDGETVTDVNNLFFKYSMEGETHHIVPQKKNAKPCNYNYLFLTQKSTAMLKLNKIETEALIP